MNSQSGVKRGNYNKIIKRNQAQLQKVCIITTFIWVNFAKWFNYSNNWYPAKSSHNGHLVHVLQNQKCQQCIIRSDFESTSMWGGPIQHTTNLTKLNLWTNVMALLRGIISASVLSYLIKDQRTGWITYISP